MNTPDTVTSEWMWSLTLDEAKTYYVDVLTRGNPDELRWMCRHDRFFLLVYGMGRIDAAHPWIYARCREVEREPEGYLDLWSRGHFKTTIITLAGTIQEILKDPDITIGIFSSTIALARKCVAAIQLELERPKLVELFPDILYEKIPMRGWSAEKGLIVQRRSNPKEPTLQAAGLLDGQPIGAHYQLRIYDDIVTPETVTTPDQIKKTTAAWELSLALGTTDGGRTWYCGTRYHPNDTYGELIQRKVLKERRRICYDADGNSVLMSEDQLRKKRIEMGERTFAAQMLQDPIGEGMRTFRDEWFNTIDLTAFPRGDRHNRYILIDSANAKRKGSDYTVFYVIGLGADRNYYVLEALRDRLNLAERTRTLFDLVEKWTPINVFWEQVGLASDVQHVRLEQDARQWHFNITEVAQTVPKNDRIAWLIPLFEAGRIWFPSQMLRRSVAGDTYDFVQDFLNHEYHTHPVCRHDDMLDDLANLAHPTCTGLMRFPIAPQAEPVRRTPSRTVSSWKPLERRPA